MTKKILIILSILAPFITFYLIKFAFKLSEKKVPYLMLCLASFILLVLTLVKFSLNNLLSHTKPNQIYSNKVTLINENTEKLDIDKYFFSIVIFIISLFILTLLLTLSEIQFENSFKLSILTVMNTVNSSMFELSNFDFYSLSFLTKIYLIIFMIIGRVELLTILILFKKFLFKN